MTGSSFHKLIQAVVVNTAAQSLEESSRLSHEAFSVTFSPLSIPRSLTTSLAFFLLALSSKLVFTWELPHTE